MEALSSSTLAADLEFPPAGTVWETGSLAPVCTHIAILPLTGSGDEKPEAMEIKDDSNNEP